MAKILLIEPDVVLANTIIEYLKGNHEVAWSHNGHHAVELMDKSEFDLIVSEHNFTGHNSFEFLYELRSYSEWQDLPVIIFSRSFLPDSVFKSAAWKKLGRVSYLYKPTTSLALLNTSLNQLLKTAVQSN